MLSQSTCKPVDTATRIVLVDEHVCVRETLAFVLRGDENYQVVGEASGGVEGLRVCRRENPDIVILDLILPELNGLSLFRRLRSECSTARLLVFTGVLDEQTLREAMRLEPDAFVNKSDSLVELRFALHALTGGGRYFSRSSERLLRSKRDLAMGQLTSDETAVLQMIAEGRQSKEIAGVLKISMKMVDHHRQRLMGKLNLHDVASLTRFAVRNRLIPA